MSDQSRVSPAEKAQFEFEVALIREARGISQRELAELSSVKQPAIARLERMQATPQINTLFKLLSPLGYTIK